MSDQITQFERILRKNKKLFVVIVVALALFMLSPAIISSLSSLQPYPSAYEGAKARFVGIVYTNARYTNADKQGASVAKFDTGLSYDYDPRGQGMPEIVGSMTTVFIPEKAPNSIQDWVPFSWWQSAKDMNPYTGETYEFNVKNDDGTTSVYKMEAVQTKWFVNIRANPLGQPDISSHTDEWQRRRYSDLEIWFEFDLEPSWYFEGTDKTYFAIAKIQLANILINHFGPDGQEVTSIPSEVVNMVRVNPQPIGMAVMMYPLPFDRNMEGCPDNFEGYTYEGKRLNPKYFRDKVYGCITLNDFGSWDWYKSTIPPDLRGLADSVTFDFTVTQFVVGEWKVKDIQDLDPEEFNVSPKYGRDEIIPGLADFLSSPLGQLWMFLILIGVVLVLITIFFPGFWTLVFGWLQTRKTRKGG
jgi:hypothetical protein